MNLSSFDQAIATLVHLYTKPLGTFTGSKHSPHTIAEIADFLHHVAKAIDNTSTATTPSDRQRETVP